MVFQEDLQLRGQENDLEKDVLLALQNKLAKVSNLKGKFKRNKCG